MVNYLLVTLICWYTGLAWVKLPKESFGGEIMPHACQVAPEVQIVELGPLPIVMKYLREMKVRDIIDQAVPRHSLHVVTHGEVVEALLCAIFLGTHTLSHVAETLARYDLPTLFNHPGLTSAQFNDTRIGETLDALYGKTEKLFADVVFQGIHAFHLSIKRIHTDSTTLKLYGSYDNGEQFLIKPPPIAAFGKSKDHRPDLKQLLFSQSVSDEGIPIFGRVADGNTSDVTEFRLHLEKLALMLDDLREIILVADCKLCTDPTLALAHSLGFNLVTLVPDNYALRGQLIVAASQETELPLLLTTPDGEEYRGKSFKIPFSVEMPDGTEETVWWRYLVVHSTQLEQQRRKARLREADKERKALGKTLAKAQTVPYACEADAQKVASAISVEAKAKHHTLQFTVEAREVILRGQRGRRPKGVAPATDTKYFLQGVITQKPTPACNFSPDGMFVLMTTIPDRRCLSDKKVLEAYKGQQVVEIGFHWLKGPLAVAPIFLKLLSRIDVLGFVYLISMFLYALVQRDLRREVKKHGVVIVDPCQQKTAKPTTRALFKIFEGVSRVVITHNGKTSSETRFLTPNLLLVLKVMNWWHLYHMENPLGCT